MEAALTCIPANSVSDDGIGELFGVVCGLSSAACAGIQANGTTGDYGAYAMCDSRQQLGWALNAYYAEQTSKGNGPSACGFSGSATTQNPVSPTGSCKTLIAEAGGAGTGTVTSAPSGTGSSSGSSSSGGSSSSSGKSSSSGSAGVPGISNTNIHFGYVQVGLYALVAFGSALAMIML